LEANSIGSTTFFGPNGYNKWRNENRQEYIKWLLSQSDTEEEKTRLTSELEAIKKFENSK